MRAIPPRGPALRRTQWLFEFDVDCGELVPGHHFIARGLGGPFPMDLSWLEEFAEDSYPGFNLEYELVPGIEADEFELGFDYIVPIEYTADVALPFEPSDGGAIAPATGGMSTHGSRGSWPLPADARVLTFGLSRPYSLRARQPGSPAGSLVVGLSARTAIWTPA